MKVIEIRLRRIRTKFNLSEKAMDEVIDLLDEYDYTDYDTYDDDEFKLLVDDLLSILRHYNVRGVDKIDVRIVLQ